MTPLRRSLGFTLLEATLTIVLVASALAALSVQYMTLIEQADARVSEATNSARTRSVLAEIEEAIRSSTRLRSAGSGLLVAVTRSFVDDDLGVELVRYELVGNELRRQIAQGRNGSYGAPEVLLDNVTGFTVSAFEINDAFFHEDYADLASKTDGLPSAVDTTNRVRYTLAELGTVDPSLKSSYREDLEALQIGALVGGDSVCLSPPLPRDGIVAETTFVPATTLTVYSALRYGEEGLGKDVVSIVFELGNIRLQSWESGTLLVEDVATTTFSSNELFKVRLHILGDHAYTEIEGEAGSETLGPVVIPHTLDNERFWALSTTTRGWWDDLSIRYETIEIALEVTTDGETTTLVGAAASRQ